MPIIGVASYDITILYHAKYRIRYSKFRRDVEDDRPLAVPDIRPSDIRSISFTPCASNLIGMGIRQLLAYQTRNWADALETQEGVFLLKGSTQDVYITLIYRSFSNGLMLDMAMSSILNFPKSQHPVSVEANNSSTR